MRCQLPFFKLWFEKEQILFLLFIGYQWFLRFLSSKTGCLCVCVCVYIKIRTPIVAKTCWNRFRLILIVLCSNILTWIWGSTPSDCRIFCETGDTSPSIYLGLLSGVSMFAFQTHGCEKSMHFGVKGCLNMFASNKSLSENKSSLCQSLMNLILTACRYLYIVLHEQYNKPRVSKQISTFMLGCFFGRKVHYMTIWEHPDNSVCDFFTVNCG